MKGPFAVAAWLAATGTLATVAAQTDASLGVGAGTVRYAGGATFSSLSLAPSFQWSGAAALDLGGLLSSLPAGEWAMQARGNVWAPLLAEARVLRPAVAATVTGSKRSDGGSAGAAHGLLEMLWLPARAAGRWGAAFGAGPSVGAISDEAPVTALRFRARTWAQPSAQAPQYTLILEPTRFLGAWYTDVTAGATLERGRVTVEAWALGRFSRVYGSKGTASAAIQLRLSPSVSLEGAAGGYLPEPFQGFPRAGFVSAAVRLHARHRIAAPVATLAPLVPARRGDSVVVRFHMPGAASVAIAGDWTGWSPVALVPVGSDVWEGSLTLPPGTYHFNLVVDGAEWVVPGGVATIADGMGGLLAILVVP
jgi:AMP-activated protein kinase-like protein